MSTYSHLQKAEYNTIQKQEIGATTIGLNYIIIKYSSAHFANVEKQHCVIINLAARGRNSEVTVICSCVCVCVCVSDGSCF